MKTINNLMSKIERNLDMQQKDFMFNNNTNLGIVNTFTDCTLNQKICTIMLLKSSNFNSHLPILTTYLN